MRQYLDILADAFCIATFQHHRRRDHADFQRLDEPLPSRPYRAWPREGQGRRR